MCYRLNFSLWGAIKFKIAAVHFESQVLWFHLVFFWNLWWTNPKHSWQKKNSISGKIMMIIKTVGILDTGVFQGQIPRNSLPLRSPHCRLGGVWTSISVTSTVVLKIIEVSTSIRLSRKYVHFNFRLNCFLLPVKQQCKKIKISFHLIWLSSNFPNAHSHNKKCFAFTRAIQSLLMLGNVLINNM